MSSSPNLGAPEFPARSAPFLGIAYAAIAFLVPVCATLLLGGADWGLNEDLVLSWYGGADKGAVAWLLLGALSAWCACARLGRDVKAGEPSSSATTAGISHVHALEKWSRRFSAIGLAAAVLAIWIDWTGGFRLPGLSLRSPELSAVLASALLLIATAFSMISTGSRPTLRTVSATVLAAFVGLVFFRGIVALDANNMLGALEAQHDRRSMAAAAATPTTASPAAREAELRDLIWIVVDTLRADALGAYAERAGDGMRQGEEGAEATATRTPFLDALARRSLVFERALAPAPWTMPSMFSAFTSRWPSSLDPEGRGRSRASTDRIGLASSVTTWLGPLRSAGYRTSGFQKNPFLGEGSGLETRFDLYRLVGGDRAEGESAAQLVNAALRWGDVMHSSFEEGDAPFFLYLHFMDPHIDYAAPEEWLSAEAQRYAGEIDGRARTLHGRLEGGAPISASERVQLQRLYAAEVAYLDAELARLWDGLEARGVLDAETLVVITADHGEQFGEHGGWEHGDLFSENLHVPFFITGGDISPGRVPDAVSLLDLGPTLLGLLGLPALDDAEGRDLLKASGESQHRRRELDRETDTGLRSIVSEYGARARVERGRWVWIEGRGDPGDGGGGLFDRLLDPGETRDLSLTHPTERDRLREALRLHRDREKARSGAVRSRSIPGELEAELEALGYGASPENRSE